MLAAHVAGARVYWLCGVFGEPGADRTPWPHPLTDPGWEDDETHPRTGAELAGVLESSWGIVADCLRRWTVDDLDGTATRLIGGTTRIHTRASVLNRLLSHDSYHAGEISQLLGANGLTPIDPWAPRPPGRS